MSLIFVNSFQKIFCFFDLINIEMTCCLDLIDWLVIQLVSFFFLIQNLYPHIYFDFLDSQQSDDSFVVIHLYIFYKRRTVMNFHDKKKRKTNHHCLLNKRELFDNWSSFVWKHWLNIRWINLRFESFSFIFSMSKQFESLCK